MCHPQRLSSFSLLSLKQVPVSESPLFFATAYFEGGVQCLLRASQTYATQLCSITGDQNLHNLYPSYQSDDIFSAQEPHE